MKNACAQFACRVFLARLANGAIVVLEHPSAMWLWAPLQLHASALQPSVEEIFFEHCHFGARVPPRQSDSPILPKHFQCQTKLDGWARLQFFGSALPTEREHNLESPSPSALPSSFPRRSPGFCAKSTPTTWRALSVQPLGSQVDRWRRFFELLFF